MALDYADLNIDAVDMNRKMLDNAHKDKRINYILADIKHIPAPKDAYDRVFSAYGLGGVDDPAAAFEEIVRTAKPGGRVTIAEMSAPPDKGLSYVIHKSIVEPMIRSIWEFRDLDLDSLMSNAGIEIDVSEHYHHRVLGSTALRSGIVRK